MALETLKRGATFWLQGWAIWGLALALALLLPGLPRGAAQPPEFPWEVLPATVMLLAGMALCALVVVWLSGPSAARCRSLTLWEAPPDLLWGGLTLVLWPATWGPPGRLAWAIAFGLAALPSEIRWLSQALPEEVPFPALWGESACRRMRALALLTLAPRWFGVRLPLWLTATLVLERIIGVRGLGSDWMARVAVHDHLGLALWILTYGLVWTLAQAREVRS